MRLPHWLWILAAGCAPVPEGADRISAHELAELEATGELLPWAPWDAASVRARADARFAENRAVVESFVAEHPELAERLLAEATGTPTGDGNVTTELPDGRTVVLQGDADRMATIARTIEARSSHDNQARLLEALLPGLPGVCREGLPGPGEVDALPVDVIRGFVADAAACLRDWHATQAGPPRDPVPPPAGFALDGGGEDASSTCEPPSSWALATFDHAWALSPIKDQANRGACVAFGTAGALEYAVARNFGRYVDFSEQALYAYGKFDVRDGEHYGDGLFVDELAEFLDDGGPPVPFEGTWGYNPSTQRMICDGASCGLEKEEDGDRYVDSCVGYDGPACSETTHQMRLVSQGGSTWWWRPAAEGTEYERLSWLELGILEDSDDIDTAIALLESGWGLVVGMDVTERFKDADFREGGPIAGGHAMQVANILRDPLADGGALVLLRNSWGCGWAANGYGTVSAAYIEEYAHSLTALKPRRGSGNEPPEPLIEAPENGASFSLGGIENAVTFHASGVDLEDVDCCSFDWSSDRDGYMGRGAEIEHTFVNPGQHLITLTAWDRDGGRGEAFIVVQVNNLPPAVTIEAPGASLRSPMVGQYVSFVGSSFDLTDPLGVPCDRYQWTSSHPGDDFPRTGCDMAARFLTTGTRTVTLRVTDTLGSTGSDTVDIAVRPFDPDADPTITIHSPAAGDGLDPWSPVTLSSSNTATGFHAVFWSIDTNHQSYELGSGSTTSVVLGDLIPPDCGFESATLWAEVTQGTNRGGTTSIPVFIGWDPC